MKTALKAENEGHTRELSKPIEVNQERNGDQEATQSCACVHMSRWYNNTLAWEALYSAAYKIVSNQINCLYTSFVSFFLPCTYFVNQVEQATMEQQLHYSDSHLDSKSVLGEPLQ